MHDCVIYIGHLENIGPLRYTDLTNVDMFMQYMKMTIFNINTDHQKALSVRRLSSLQKWIQVFQKSNFYLKA